MNAAFQRLSVLGLALLAFAGAELVGGNGFIAAFVAGLTLGNTARAVCGCLYEFGEAEGQLLTLLVFLTFGAVMVPEAWPYWDGRALLYAVLSLTVVRMLPVVLSLLGAGLLTPSLAFIGWFGPRGVPSGVPVPPHARNQLRNRSLRSPSRMRHGAECPAAQPGFLRPGQLLPGIRGPGGCQGPDDSG